MKNPNPFNAQTNISFVLPEAGHVKLDIFNLQGRKAASLINGVVEAGYHNIDWDASSYASGIYFYRRQAGNEAVSKRVVLLQ